MEAPLSQEQEKQILDFIKSEVVRVHYGKVFFELTVINKRVSTIQGETRRSLDLKPKQEKAMAG